MGMNSIDRYDSLIKYYTQKHIDEDVIDWSVIKNQVIAESYDHRKKDLNPRAVSPAGAKGLMQFMPATWKEWDDKENIPACDHPFNAEENIEAGCKYDAHLYSCYEEIPDPKERIKFMLAAYNAGRGNINEMLSYAREGTNLPFSFSDWAKDGRPSGVWQNWDFAKRFLNIVTGSHARETIDYVDKIINRRGGLK